LTLDADAEADSESDIDADAADAGDPDPEADADTDEDSDFDLDNATLTYVTWDVIKYAAAKFRPLLTRGTFEKTFSDPSEPRTLPSRLKL
jgi:hypothetical protein